jgi:uncharacterized protein YeaO (DUF488 family)
MTHELPTSQVRLKRAYEPAVPKDGVRVLVDRLWPRGLRKADAAIDRWMKDIAPSTELRRWFGHDPERWPASVVAIPRNCSNKRRQLTSYASWPEAAGLHWSSRHTMKRTTMPSCCAMRFCSRRIVTAQPKPA